VLGHPVSNDEANGFGPRNVVMLGYELVNAGEHVRLKSDLNGSAFASRLRSPFLWYHSFLLAHGNYDTTITETGKRAFLKTVKSPQEK
jgi:hypothetical protein